MTEDKPKRKGRPTRHESGKDTVWDTGKYLEAKLRRYIKLIESLTPEDFKRLEENQERAFPGSTQPKTKDTLTK